VDEAMTLARERALSLYASWWAPCVVGVVEGGTVSFAVRKTCDVTESGLLVPAPNEAF